MRWFNTRCFGVGRKWHHDWHLSLVWCVSVFSVLQTRSLCVFCKREADLVFIEINIWCKVLFFEWKLLKILSLFLFYCLCNQKKPVLPATCWTALGLQFDQWFQLLLKYKSSQGWNWNYDYFSLAWSWNIKLLLFISLKKMDVTCSLYHPFFTNYLQICVCQCLWQKKINICDKRECLQQNQSSSGTAFLQGSC